ncbi:hypothetical protein PG994_012591 [Apiospora phragmitis]|uniref:Uncharacterized protein n=1 Tax=Apiospora phragmitis TaxID=2905665 RepID=A0ABR1TAW0_9PEZI
MPFQGAVSRILANLLPLIHRSPKPRVLSTLNGTKEKRINDQDIGLEKKWGIVSVVDHTTICTSLAFDYLSANETLKKTAFIHATPGFVISGWIIVYFGKSLSESGERHAYLLSTESISPGSSRTNKENDVVPDNEVLKYYHERNQGETIWNHTAQVREAALGRS